MMRIINLWGVRHILYYLLRGKVQRHVTMVEQQEQLVWLKKLYKGEL